MLNVVNPSNLPNPVLAIDLGLICIDEGALKVLLIARDDSVVVGGEWALPGGIVHIDESLEQTALRVLKVKANLDNFHLEQLETFGALGRDPRGRVVSVAYFALTPDAQRLKKIAEQPVLTLAKIDLPTQGATSPLTLRDEDGGVLTLAFDHDVIISRIVARVRGKLDYTPIGLSLLPEQFTLRDVQRVFETIKSTKFSKPPFRRKLLDRNIIQPTGILEAASNFRPAELYKRLQ